MLLVVDETVGYPFPTEEQFNKTCGLIALPNSATTANLGLPQRDSRCGFISRVGTTRHPRLSKLRRNLATMIMVASGHTMAYRHECRLDAE